MDLIACSPSEAQKHCHFVIFASTFLPPHVVMKEEHLRPESNAHENRREHNRSTFRQVFAGAGRRLVMKQFLYDWAPPAYDYPCLWRNAEIATQAESPAPTGQFVNNNVLWFGKNYRKQTAATIEIERTRIELTFEEGSFSHQEIVSLCKGLVPVDREIAKHLLSVPFSKLSYSHRHEEPVVSVPVGFWGHCRAEELLCFTLAQEEIPALCLQAIQPFTSALKTQNYAFSGGFGFGKTKAQLEEVECLFEHQNTPGCFVRVLCTPDHSPFSIVIPPTLGDQECTHKTLHIHEKTFYYATSKTFACGSHEIVFKKGAFHCMILIKPAPWTTFEWVLSLLT